MATAKEKLTFASILKDSNYDLSLFSDADKKGLASKIKLVKK